MLPAPPGSIATYSKETNERELPIVAFNHEGDALVGDGKGRLVPADSAPLGRGWTLDGVHVPTNDPIVHVEFVEPRACLIVGSEETVIAWAITASGETRVVVDYFGTPWVHPEDVKELEWPASET